MHDLCVAAYILYFYMNGLVFVYLTCLIMTPVVIVVLLCLQPFQNDH